MCKCLPAIPMVNGRKTPQGISGRRYSLAFVCVPCYSLAEMNERYDKHIHLRPRLSCVASLMPKADTIADIGCDHGRLGMGLLQQRIARRAILSEISPASLAKARRLAAITGLTQSIDFRVGDGLSVLNYNEADAIAICGMGGMLIRDMLISAKAPLMGADMAVLLPMRGIDELREYLYFNGYRITADRIAYENGRLYQTFSIERGRDEMPADWPKDCFCLGFHAVDDPLFPRLHNMLLSQAEQCLISAKGSSAESFLAKRADMLRQIGMVCISRR